MWSFFPSPVTQLPRPAHSERSYYNTLLPNSETCEFTIGKTGRRKTTPSELAFSELLLSCLQQLWHSSSAQDRGTMPEGLTLREGHQPRGLQGPVLTCPTAKCPQAETLCSTAASVLWIQSGVVWFYRANTPGMIRTSITALGGKNTDTEVFLTCWVPLQKCLLPHRAQLCPLVAENCSWGLVTF